MGEDGRPGTIDRSQYRNHFLLLTAIRQIKARPPQRWHSVSILVNSESIVHTKWSIEFMALTQCASVIAKTTEKFQSVCQAIQ